MTGKLDLSGWAGGVQRIRDQVEAGQSATAENIRTQAVLRAPIRKAFGSKHRPTKVDLDSFKMKVGRTSQYTAKDLRDAATMLGIGPGDLNISRHKRGAALEIQTGRSGGANRETFRGRRERRMVDGQIRYPRVTGRDLREVEPIRVQVPVPRGAKPKTRIIAYRPNSKRLKSQGVSLSARARYDIAHGRGIVRSQNGRYQYGGHLRKSIRVENPRRDGMRTTVTVRSGAAYSRYVEFPTSRTAAQPYLLPALKGARERYASNIRRG